MIPLMKDVINTFGGCTPAFDWAKEMDVQKGWEVCVEPGWLMLLAFSTQNQPNAVGFKQSVACEVECIKPCLKFIRDSLILDIFNEAIEFAGNPTEEALEGLQRGNKYLLSMVKLRYNEIQNKVSNQSFFNENMPEYFAMNAVTYFVNAMINYKNDKRSAQWANSAVDATVNSLLAEYHPDFVGGAFGIGSLHPKEIIEEKKLQIKIDICNILRKSIPKPFIKYE